MQYCAIFKQCLSHPNIFADDLKKAHPEINWRRLSGFRNVLVHDYLGINLKTVWQLVEEELPVLKGQIEAILTELDEE